MASKTTPTLQVDYADELAYLLRVTGSHLPEANREYCFSRDHAFRFDFAWPERQVAVEVNGGRWLPGGGRHAQDSDHWKLAIAASEGWRVLPVTITMLQVNPWRFLDLLERALEVPATEPPPEWIQTTPRVEYETRPTARPCSAQGGCDCAADED